MTDSNKIGDEKIELWKYDFAWNQLENAQLCNDVLDNKAMNNINFSSIIIPIITGILLYISDKAMVKSWTFIFMADSLIFLIMSVFFAYAVFWPKDQGGIQTIKHLKAIDGYDLIDIIKGTSNDLADWQKKIVDAGECKGKNLLISSSFFVSALLSIVLSLGMTLFF